MTNELINNNDLNSNNSVTHTVMKMQNSSEFLSLIVNCQSFNSIKFVQTSHFSINLIVIIVQALLFYKKFWFSEAFNLTSRQISNYELLSIHSELSKHGVLLYLYMHNFFFQLNISNIQVLFGKRFMNVVKFLD